ncbi:M28 family peptidase [Candidatus Parcubacteria bacterium]|nr:M28 family peptidase [Candidatus Parcubacteria bacterium]
MHIEINKEQLYKDVEYLVNIQPPRNNNNIESLNKAADFIIERFKSFGCDLEIQKYSVMDKEYKNIICAFGLKEAERIIIGAHYDVFFNQPGADDNASGIAGLLELGRLINENQLKLKDRIDLVAYTLEEPPYFKTDKMGSAVHARSLYEANIKVKAMIALEMIGYFSDKPNSQTYPSLLLKLIYPNKGNYITIIGKFKEWNLVKKIKKGMIASTNISVKSVNAPIYIPGIDFSDHLNFWQYKYKAVMVTDTSFYRNKNYHEKSDTIETLDFNKMSEVIKGVYSAVINL